MVNENFEKLINKIKDKEIEFKERNNYFLAWLQTYINKITIEDIKKALEMWDQMESDIINNITEIINNA